MMMPAGTYRAQAVDGHLGLTSKSNEQIVVKFVIVDGPQKDQTVSWYGFFSDACFDRTIQSLRYCGWQGDDVSDMAGIDRNDVDIVVEHDEYQGKVTPKVRWINQVGGGAGMSAAQAADFAQSIKPRIAGMKSADPDAEESVPF
ncbi:MAG TPA: hypothetical protein VN444_04000 [Verrucomicrobiae bacterium]|nr:hypothetical protein [Verrucomicrobiae bacterium]